MKFYISPEKMRKQKMTKGKLFPESQKKPDTCFQKSQFLHTNFPVLDKELERRTRQIEPDLFLLGIK